MLPTSDRPLSKSERIQFAEVVLGTLLVMLAFQLLGCAPHAPTPAVVETGLTPTQEHGIAVVVHMTCEVPDLEALGSGVVSEIGDPDLDADLDALLGSIAPTKQAGWVGSGVLISVDHILTNAHVVTCAEGKLVGLHVDVGDGVWRPAIAEVVIAKRDIARVRLLWATPTTYVRPIELGEMPAIGDEICETPGYPMWGYKCGIVQPSPTGAIWAELHVLHGNSGSAVWRRGRLVGLTYAVTTCEDGMQCIGAVTPLVGMDWLLGSALTGPGGR